MPLDHVKDAEKYINLRVQYKGIDRMTEKTLIRVSSYSDKEINKALDAWDNHYKKTVIREELGGDYFYRCPWLKCNKIARREWVACPYCGQMLFFEED